MSRLSPYSTPEALKVLADSQGGCVTFGQAAECGVDRHAIRRRKRLGVWRECFGCFVTDPHQPIAALQLAWAMRLRAGPASIVSGSLAIELAGLSGPVGQSPRLILLTRVPQRVRLSGVHVCVGKRAGTKPRTHDSGLVFQAPSEAVLDILQRIGGRAPHEWLQWLDWSLQQRILTVGHLERACRRRVNSGRAGSKWLRAAREYARGGTQSAAERLLRSILDTHSIDGFEGDHPVCDPRDGTPIARLDFAHPTLKLNLEADGRAFHSSRKHFERDRERQNRVVRSGWQVLRFTWDMLTRDPGEVAASIQEAMADRAAERGLVFAPGGFDQSVTSDGTD